MVSPIEPFCCLQRKFGWPTIANNILATICDWNLDRLENRYSLCKLKELAEFILRLPFLGWLQGGSEIPCSRNVLDDLHITEKRKMAGRFTKDPCLVSEINFCISGIGVQIMVPIGWWDWIQNITHVGSNLRDWRTRFTTAFAPQELSTPALSRYRQHNTFPNILIDVLDKNMSPSALNKWSYYLFIYL